MTAIVSVMMIGLGFITGMAVTDFMNNVEIKMLRTVLQRAVEQKFKTDQLLDDLRNQANKEKHKKEELLTKLLTIVKGCEPLPPPEPLTRSDCMYCDSDDESEDFVNPASPDPKQHKD